VVSTEASTEGISEVGIHPGRYNVFNEDGSLFKWGGESVHASLTIKNRVQFFIGDNEEPETECYLPKSVKCMNDFDSFTLGVFSGALVIHVAQYAAKLAQLQDAHREVIARRRTDNDKMISGSMPVWRWIERHREFKEYQEVCESLMKETHQKLVELAPSTITGIFIFSES
jgi:hypothetical protein